MPRTFDVPPFFRSSTIGGVKLLRRQKDPRKKDLAPSHIDFGPVRFKIARHFGFCFGVENAIEIAYRTVAENPDRRIFLVSEMIHNPEVNDDLRKRGVQFLLDTAGREIVPLATLTAEDIVIVPAFGTTIELQKRLEELGVDPYRYDTTCPFVEKVWKRADELGANNFAVIVHGKRTHEETRATFSHSNQTAPTLIILDIDDALFIAEYISGKCTRDEFLHRFEGAMSHNFDPDVHLQRVGVINQTTMLATETKQIAAMIREALVTRFGQENVNAHFADTRDTLCYATYENQTATQALIDSGMDIAVVVGGYNSSNTSHLVELCEASVPTFYIQNSKELLSQHEIRHFALSQMSIVTSKNWIPEQRPLTIGLTSGASCPDRIIEEVLLRIVSFFPEACSAEVAFAAYLNSIDHLTV